MTTWLIRKPLFEKVTYQVTDANLQSLRAYLCPGAAEKGFTYSHLKILSNFFLFIFSNVTFHLTSAEEGRWQSVDWWRHTIMLNYSQELVQIPRYSVLPTVRSPFPYKYHRISYYLIKKKKASSGRLRRPWILITC